MNKKINFDELSLDKDQGVLEALAQKDDTSKKNKKIKKSAIKTVKKENYTEQIKVALTFQQKKELGNKAGYNISAFVRNILIKHGYIK